MILLNKKRINRTIKRMSYQMIEEAHNQSIRLIGLNERGYSVAEKIKKNLDEVLDYPVPLDQLDSDDNSTIHYDSDNTQDSILFIIDDVIFSGGSMFRAIQKISELSGFEKIFVVVLVDRGHRKFPVHAEIVGVDAPTKLNEQVELHLKDGSPNQVVLIEE